MGASGYSRNRLTPIYSHYTPYIICKRERERERERGGAGT